MNTKTVSVAVIALALSSCDQEQKRAETFVKSNSKKEFRFQPNNEGSDDMIIGRVVGRWAQSEGTAPIRLYLMIDTNGDETAEYVGYLTNANNSTTMGIAYNAEVTRQKKPIAQWKGLLIDFKKIPQENTR